MLEQTITNSYNTFWFIIFISIVIIVISVVIAIVIIKLKNKDTDIFFKSNDNAKEITLDNNKTHTQIVSGLPIVYHKEIHDLEKAVRENDNRIVELAKELNEKMDLLLDKVIKLENKFLN